MENRTAKENPRFEIISDEEIEAFVKALPAMPSLEEAREIVNNAKIINKGTNAEFVEGCFGNRYRDAITVLQLEKQGREDTEKLGPLGLARRQEEEVKKQLLLEAEEKIGHLLSRTERRSESYPTLYDILIKIRGLLW